MYLTVYAALIPLEQQIGARLGYTTYNIHEGGLLR
jgi:hypothetical protein